MTNQQDKGKQRATDADSLSDEFQARLTLDHQESPNTVDHDRTMTENTVDSHATPAAEPAGVVIPEWFTSILAFRQQEAFENTADSHATPAAEPAGVVLPAWYPCSLAFRQQDASTGRQDATSRTMSENIADSHATPAAEPASVRLPGWFLSRLLGQQDASENTADSHATPSDPSPAPASFRLYIAGRFPGLRRGLPRDLRRPQNPRQGATAPAPSSAIVADPILPRPRPQPPLATLGARGFAEDHHLHTPRRAGDLSPRDRRAVNGLADRVGLSGDGSERIHRRPRGRFHCRSSRYMESFSLPGPSSVSRPTRTTSSSWLESHPSTSPQLSWPTDDFVGTMPDEELLFRLAHGAGPYVSESQSSSISHNIFPSMAQPGFLAAGQAGPATGHAGNAANGQAAQSDQTQGPNHESGSEGSDESEDLYSAN